MKHRPVPLLGALLIALSCSLLSGCATIVKGTTQEIPISSDPTGARVAIDGKPAGTTPTKVTLERKRSHMVTLEKDDYETENIAITNSIGGAVVGNLVAGGLVGWGVDAMTGAQYNLHPTTIAVRLRPTNLSSAPAPAPSKTGSLSDELAKLDELRTGGRISEEEHGKLRAALLASYQGGATSAAPAEK